jgi:hypothetical protein
MLKERVRFMLIERGGRQEAAMTRRKSFRSQLNRAARDLGNIEAVEHGGVSGGAKRYARRAVYRKINTVTGSFLRALGLSGSRRKR